MYADAPHTTRTEGAVARQIAIDPPMLMMIRQNGPEDLGWRGTPFYRPWIPMGPARAATQAFEDCR